MNAQEQAAAVRRGAGLFRLAHRGLARVEGSDRVRWLDGMISNQVSDLEPGPERSGCYALLLTRQGRIVADLHVLLRGESFWLEADAPAVACATATLERFIIADDVRLRDAAGDFERLALEGPAAPALLEAVAGRALPLAADACGDAEIAGVPVVVAAFGWSGEPARQLFAPAGSGERVATALLQAGSSRGLLEAGAEALEILRIEAGIPRFGSELGEDVLPAEARLERAVSFTKGCYTGQEVVARMESRGRAAHRLVGFALEGDAAPQSGAEVSAGDRRIGEVTSACVSPAFGAVALGYVRSAHEAPGTAVSVAGRAARVAALPFASA